MVKLKSYRTYEKLRKFYVFESPRGVFRRHPMEGDHVMQRMKFLAAVSSLALSLAFAGTAYAAGTPAGTVILNTATATFTTGTSPGTVTSNTVSVKVDELLNVTVTSLLSAPVSAGSGPATLVWSVTNNGNGNEPFNLTANPAVAGNPFNGTIQTLAIDTNNDGVYEAGTDTIITNGAASPVIAPDGNVHVVALINLPAGATDAQTSQIQLTAASVLGTGTPGRVFAGKGNGGVDAVVGATGATGSSLESIIASLATVALTKTAAVLDPFGGNSPVPGAVVTYSLVAHTTGSGTANGVTVTDSFPAGTTYQTGSITLNGTGLTDAADGDTGTATGTGISVGLGNLAGGAPDKTVTFKVKIN